MIGSRVKAASARIASQAGRPRAPAEITIGTYQQSIPRCKHTEQFDPGDDYGDEDIGDVWHPGHPSNYGDK